MGRLYRSRHDRWISGLIGGLGEHFGISSTILRILFLISIPATGCFTLFVYFITMLVVPKEPYQPYDPYNNGGWQSHGSYHGNSQPYGSGQSYGGGQQFGGHQQYGGPYGGSQQYSGGYNNYNNGPKDSDNLDSMMKDIEKKAMQKELEELRKKLAKYEKGEV